MQEAPAHAPVDGRTLRSLRTRVAIVDATMALIEEGNLRPTAPRVAERASVSVRSIFQHFADLESLHAAVAERLVERVAVLVVPVEPEGPLSHRLARFVHQRCELLEALTPIRRAAAVHGPFSSEIRTRLLDGHLFLRAELERTFAAELDERAESARDVIVDGLDAALSWPTWESLRAGLGRDAVTAERVLRRMAASILTA